MIHRLAPLAALLVLMFAAGGAQAGGEFERLFALDDADHVQHDAAETWWEGLADAAKIQLLRRALASDDEPTARLAARGVGHPYLDSQELDRKMRLLHGDLEAAFGSGASWGMLEEIAIGADDVVPLYRTAAASDELAITRSTLDGLHRCARPLSAPALVALLETKNKDVFTSLLFTILNLGDFDREDTQRAAIARGALYGLRRLRTERAGKPAPKLADTTVTIESAEGGGLPAAVIEIARATHPDEENGFTIGGYETPLSVSGPLDWLRRWLLDLTPGPKDVDYLHEVVAVITTSRGHHYHDGLLRWALRHLLRMRGPRGKTQVEAWSKEDRRLGLYAAAALAEAGRPEAFRRHVETKQPTEYDSREASIDVLLWALEPAAAASRESGRMVQTGPLERHSPFYESGLIWEGRRELARYEDTQIRQEDLDALASRLWGADYPDRIEKARRLAWFHSAVHPSGLDATRTSALVDLLLALPALDWADIDFMRWERFFAVLEVRDRAGTVRVLSRWMTTQPSIRDRLMPLLARLGVPGHTAAMVAAWEAGDLLEMRALGRVPGKEIEAFLRAQRPAAQPKDDDAGDSWTALFALLERSGLSPTLTTRWAQVCLEAWDGGDADLKRLVAAWKFYEAGDSTGCLLSIAEWIPYGLHALGAVDDERVRTWLRQRRAAREHGQYWQVTAALAHHDAAAAKDLRDLLSSGRTWLLSHLENDGLALHDRTYFTAILTGDLDTNCCLSWAAGLHVKNLWPWFEVRFGMGAPGTRATRDYIRAHSWKHSAIFEGLVPAPR